MRRIADDVYVAQSDYWQMNTGMIIRAGRAVIIDAGVFPQELSNLANDLAGVAVVAGIATHDHWDHVLWSAELGSSTPRLASETTVRVSRERWDELMTRVTAEQQAAGVEWDRDLIAQLAPIPFGPLGVEPSLELLDLDGHSDGHSGVLVANASVAFVGDTVSDIDPPALPGGRAGASRYVATLDRLQELIRSVDTLVPGHGQVCGPAEAQRRLDADRRYLDVTFEVVDNATDDPAPALAEQIAARLADPRLQSATGWALHLTNVAELIPATTTEGLPG